MKKTNDKMEAILSGNMYGVIGSLALPIILNNLIQTLYNLADGVWVSKIGSVPFAAVAFVWPVVFLFISIGSGLSIAGTSLLSQLLGADEKEEANRYASQLVVVSVLASAVFMVVARALCPIIIRLMGAEGELAMYANEYLSVTLLDMPFTFMIAIFTAIMHAQGNTVWPTTLSGMSAVINIILDPILIFGFGMGISGAAWATLISKCLLAGAGVVILMCGKTQIRPQLRGFRFDLEIIKRCVRVALPSTIGQSGSAIGFMVLNGCIASYGTATMAAFGMVNRITSFIQQPAMGIGAALVAIIGQNLGAGQVERAKEGFRKSFIVTALIGGIGCLLILWQDELVIHFFMQSKDDAEVISQGLTYLQYIAYSIPLMGVFSVLKGLFQGSGYTKYAMTMEIGRLWFVRLPMILVFKTFTDIGPVGIWFSMSASNLIICIYGWLLYRNGKWDQK
ncbi:MAG: MATE family efflux transporter [Cellulosilyticaceae bacterium]